MNKHARIKSIDDLRGLAIFFMILVHTSVYFLTNNYMKFLWNFSEWAVAGFVFCASFVFFISEKNIFWNEKKFDFKKYFNYLIKRIKRLVWPYFVFLPFFSVSYLIANHKFFSFSYLLKSVFFVGGVDIGWMVLLFIIFAILSPFIKYFFEKKKAIFYFLLFISFLASLIFLFIRNLGFDYKYVFWISWSLIIFYTALFIKLKRNNKFYFLSILILSFLFVVSAMIISHNHLSLNQIDNKYPPNIYHLSFGILGILGFYLLSKSGILNFLSGFLNFLSTNSYSIYFIHYLILYATAFWFVKYSNWFIFTLFIFITTLLIRKTLSVFFKKVHVGI